MAEYIEREAIEKFIEDGLNTPDMAKRFGHDAIEIMAEVHYMPAADVAPVVHGRWEWFDEETGTPFTGYEREWGWRCSYCGEELPDDYDDPDDSPTFRFCPNCGAKMDGGDS